MFLKSKQIYENHLYEATSSCYCCLVDMVKIYLLFYNFAIILLIKSLDALL